MSGGLQTTGAKQGSGQFAKGRSGNPKGRAKGVPNKATASVKEALQAAFEGLGGVDALMTWAQGKPTEFYGLWSKLIPAEIKAEVTGAGGSPLEIVVKYAGPDKG